MITTKLRKSRNPKGYGLPSLVVVLFFVSIMVNSIVEQFARETIEGRAAAAFNMVEDRLNVFAITGGSADQILPHLTENAHVRLILSPGVSGSSPEILIENRFRNGQEAILFEQKLRAFLNIPSATEISAISPEDIRRQRPERILRIGDRMATDIEMARRNISMGGEILSGTGTAEDEVVARTILAPIGSVMESPMASLESVNASSLETSGTLSGGNIEVRTTLVTTLVDAQTVDNQDYLRSENAFLGSTVVVLNFTTDRINEDLDVISFDQLNVYSDNPGTPRGIRVRDLSADTLECRNQTSEGCVRGSLSGPSAGNN